MLPTFYFPQAAVGGDERSAAKFWDNDDYVAQEKLDGARYILHKDERGSVRVYSRQISKVTGAPVIKTEQLQHLADWVKARVPNGTVLDGEVVAPGISVSNNVTKVTGSKPERAMEIQQKHGFLEYRAFDLLAWSGTDYTGISYRVRHDTLVMTLRKWQQGSPIQALTMAVGTEAKRKLYAEVIAKGGEGIILKDTNSSYHQGDRHNSWVKVKKQRTFDVVFMGIELAKETTVKKGDEEASDSRIKGLAGAIRYGQYVQPDSSLPGMALFPFSASSKIVRLKELGTVSGFDDATRADITLNALVYTAQERVLEVTAQEQFSSGALRHPRFVQWRDDKRSTDCIFRTDEG